MSLSDRQLDPAETIPFYGRMYQILQPSPAPCLTCLANISEASTAFTRLSMDSTATGIALYLVSEYERVNYYHGISLAPPELLYRSDLVENPFPTPKGRHNPTPTKTVYGVFKTPLNKVWHEVAPQICSLLKRGGIRYSAVMGARFFTHGEDETGRLGPIVIWIATRPGTTTAENAHDASPDILRLVKAFGVQDVVVEWIEGAVERLAGPPLLRVTFDTTDPTYDVRRFLTPALGMPIATKESEDDDAQGSVAFFFHENKTKRNEPSARVLGVSNRHVLRKTITDNYEFKGAGAPPQLVRVNGSRRFQRGVHEIKTLISDLRADAEFLVSLIATFQQRLTSNNPDEVKEAEIGVLDNQAKLAKIKRNIPVLEGFYNDVNAQWSDIERRNIGRLDWSPKLSIDVDGKGYTLDLGTFELDEAKFKPNFKGNVIDLGTKYSHIELTNKFYPLHNANTRTLFKYPSDRQLKIQGIVTPELLANPNCIDSNGESCLIVLKDGGSTDVTVGKYSGFEAYTADDLGQESIELAIYNYDMQSGNFSAKGDSGALIVDGLGNMVGILHSGTPRGANNFVTFATPAWWAVEKIKEQYPHADFYRTEW